MSNLKFSRQLSTRTTEEPRWELDLQGAAALQIIWELCTFVMASCPKRKIGGHTPKSEVHTGAQLGGGGGALGVCAPPTFHTLAEEMSINRSVAHSRLWLKHVLSRPSYNKYTYAPLSKLPSCAPYVMHMLYNNGLHLATRTSELLEW